MCDRGVNAIERLTTWRALPGLPGRVRQLTEGDDTLDSLRQERVKPPVPIRRNYGIVLVSISTPLTEDAVHKRVHHHVAAREPELRHEAVYAVACATNQVSANNDFMLGRILSDDQQSSTAIQSPTVKDRYPVRAAVARWEHSTVGHILDKGAKWLLHVAWIKGYWHQNLRVGAGPLPVSSRSRQVQRNLRP